ncbi:MAG: hypothetical protein HFH88_14830 [Lachnospiraceae bacterium]|nr:hypothetical protein [Lachnospiraceae bacterium]
MKRKLIEAIPEKKPVTVPEEQPAKCVTVQLSGNYLILDLWSAQIDEWVWTYRHVTDAGTGEYASLNADRKWTGECLVNAFGDYWTYPKEGVFPLSAEDKALIKSSLQIHWPADVYERIHELERTYAGEYRENKEERRLRRIQELMDKIPDPGREVWDWLARCAVGELHYAIYRKAEGTYHCTACQGDFTEKAAGGRMKHKEKAVCPLCGQALTVEKRRDELIFKTRLTIIQDLDEKQGVQRHFEVSISWRNVRSVKIRETIRCLLYRPEKRSKYNCEFYYLHFHNWYDRIYWDTGNPANFRWRSGYLYPEGIKEGLERTKYAAWQQVFSQMAAAGIKANYDRLLADTGEYFIQTVEYLFKGRFYRLLEEEAEKVDYHSGYGCYNTLNLMGESMEEVMHLQDRQKINRLRQENGGTDMLEWMRWEEDTGRKIGSAVLAWYEKSRISCERYRKGRVSGYLSPEQLMHYLERQKTETGKTVNSLFETYEDYLSMGERLKKDMRDQMVYRPRELKRRHDELVEEFERHREAIQLEENKEKAMAEAQRMREKYPGSEEILAQVKQKYEYQGEKYLVTVPENFLQITMEGMALHHCVGHTERYFDRILQHETYILFLRKKEEPDRPFYTLEVEPGGTIRQHRGMYDEEPDIEEVRPFLREWQKEIRRRMSERDYEHARISAIKREQNLEELRQKNNTRVLEALMEDLMEVV